MGGDDRLNDLAGSVSDGRSVDWDGAESRAENAEERAEILALRDVARIAEFNRTWQEGESGPGGEPGAVPRGGPLEAWGALSLLERVGAGATGEVWRAWDADLQREVALKFLHAGEDGLASGAGSPLVREARALARIRHPGVVTVYGVAEHGGRTGLWMEFLHGATLEEEIDRRGALDPGEVLRIGLRLSEALAAVEVAGLVHRDLKPANVVLSSDGRVVLTDFGLGRRRGLADADLRRASGTPIFMSPEVLAGEPATPRSDLYALGVTLRWALTGRPPFGVRTLEELKARAAAGPETALAAERPDAPASLVEAVERAMAPDPGRRFGSAAEMASVLGEAAAGSFSRPSRRWPWVAGLAALLVVAAGVRWREPLFHPRPGAPVDYDAPRVDFVPPAGADYRVEASLVERTGGSFHPLAPGDRVGPGDELSLRFHASRPLWVYVMNEDEQGETYLLFPQPLFDLRNPVPADSVAVLPGSIGGRENAWTVTSRGGREHFLVVASPQPVAEIEAELGKLPAAVPGRPVRYAPVASGTVERLRGVGGVTALPADASARGTDLFDRFESLAGFETVARGVWVRQITLENPLQ